MPDTYTSQFSGEEIDSALRAAQMISGASTPAELRDKLEIRGDTIPVSATDPTPVSEALTASGGGVNPNLLDNWYFGRPVNQRGLSEYTTTGYTVDRWLMEQSHNLKIDATGLHFTPSSSDSYTNLLQKIPVEEWNILNGKTITVSALTSDGKLLYSSGTWTPKSGPVVRFGNFEFSSAAFVDAQSYQLGRIYVYAGKSADVLAVKVELGDTQTLAHKEGDKWVLNEIPDYGEQLRRCQLYHWRFCPAEYVGSAIAFGISANAARALIYLPEQMRTNPMLNFNKNTGLFLTGTDGDIFNVTLALVWTSPNSICVEFQKSGAFAPNSVYFVRGDGSSAIDISADL